MYSLRQDTTKTTLIIHNVTMHQANAKNVPVFPVGVEPTTFA